MATWRKLGLVFESPRDRWWNVNGYTHIPTAEVLDSHRIRVYFSSLDEAKFGRIGYVDVDAANPTRVLSVAPEPVFDLGELGAFDDSGVNPSCIVALPGRKTKWMYYIGWQRTERVPYQLFAGLAAFDDTQFTRVSFAPVLPRTNTEPFFRSATTVLYEDGLFRAWYVSATGWKQQPQGLYPTYIIRHAQSSDGLIWQAHETPSIVLANDDEFGLGRPWVIKEEAGYRMWYSVRSRSQPYRIGYATSPDGLIWTRLDHEAGIERSASGWDSEMICYPCVVDAGGQRYMFYNGNQHGASGFGCAVLEQDT
jgi:hypothetical protein